MSILVNGELVEDGTIRQEANLIRPKLAEAMPDDDELAINMRAWEWARENVIERVLLKQATDLDPGIIEKVTAHVPRPNNKQVAAYYRDHRESFLSPEQIHASHIVKNIDENNTEEAALAGIQAAQAALDAGRKFTEVADEFSDCPGQGGALGWFPPGQMVDEFDAIVFALEPDAVSPIFRTPFGFHIAKVHNKRPPGIPPLEEVEQHIFDGLYSSLRQQALEAYLDDLRAKADIKKVP
jgi:parvulin-like peptidyl-prolyl isomerase